ncbi:MAG TPA: hypothetical protein VFM19_02460 [Candidatus Limnocylindria bacterium]|nr:hypothetical protein [Candidatus Limnocylindria bacterium]
MPSPRRPFARPLAAGLALALALGACGGGVDRPSDCTAASVEREVTLTAAMRLDPESIVVCRDQAVTLTVQAEAEGVLHLHGYDDQASAIQVSVGQTATLAFDAVRSGQFIIEFHPAEGEGEVEAGILTVDEP